MLYLTVCASFWQDQLFLAAFTLLLKIPTVTVVHTQDFAILQSKQQTWRTYEAGEGRVIDDIICHLIVCENDNVTVFLDLFVEKP